ncbi:MAG: prolyl oligopeptidase family serine peptidase [Bacteroidetes bacterium]|nr:prolyl oligopeptidase family serine peptidase [Bacteroidota bacterium]
MRTRNLVLLLLLSSQTFAQTPSLLPFKKYPFPTGLTAAAVGSNIAWALDEEGRRNVYVTTGPAFIPRQLTSYTEDDGQEITSLSLSPDGQWVVFVRGGDHGANWDDDLPVNPAGDTQPFKVQLAVAPFSGGPVKYLSEGDDPVISPDSKEVAFIKGDQAWSAPLDGSTPAKNLFTTRGKVGSLQWSPDGRQLLFVAGRSDHSVIGIYSKGSPGLKWIAPSFNRDEMPRWSPDGRLIVFVRRPGSGGAPDSLLVSRPQPWSIYIADTSGAAPALLWKAPATPRGSYPATDGGANLHWAAGNHIVFLSYHDGWPHLYSIDAGGGHETLLTPGNFMCEHIIMSPDRRRLLFSANAGPDALDIERRHAATVSVDHPDMQVLTPGDGLEWTPTLTGDGSTWLFISATAQRPPLPAVLKDNKIRLLGADKLANYPTTLVIPRQVTFRSEDGVTVHADLFLPPNTNTRLPAIVFVHGGPSRQMLLGWHYSDYYSNAYASNQYLASLGFIVLSVNYRLGIGYGYEFHKPAAAGAAGASEYRDIHAAGLWLKKQKFVDTSRIGIYGGSYGGYLTALALAKDSRIFAAGVDFHGVHDWTVQGNTTTGKEKYEKAPDFDAAQKVAWLSSPVSSINTWHSPVLIIQGDDDRNVRFNQSVDLIQRLEKKGIPYETLMIVDDTHHWMKFSNAVKVYGAAADYFVKKFLR